MTKNIEQSPTEIRRTLRIAAVRAIKLLGGPTKAAQKLNKVGDNVYQQLLSHWMHREQYVPLKHVKFMVRALDGQMTAEEIRPDYF